MSARKPREKLHDVVEKEEVSWAFASDAALMKKLEGQAKELAFRHSLDWEDVLQETYLWLAARPALQEEGHGMILGQTRAVAQKMGEKERAGGAILELPHE